MEAVSTNLAVDVSTIKKVEGFTTPAEILAEVPFRFTPPCDARELMRANLAARNAETVKRRRRRPKTNRRVRG